MGIDGRQAVFAGVPLLANRMQAHYDARLDGLTLKQWLALIVVHNLPQPVPSTAVVTAALGTSHQNVTKLLTALVDKGLLTLDPSPSDRRARQVSVTPHALASLAAEQRRGEAMLGDLFAGVDPADLAACLRVLQQMSVNLTGEPLVPEWKA